MWMQARMESTKEQWTKAWGRAEKTRDPIPRPPKTDKCSSCQLTGTPKLISHRRLLGVLCYQSLAKLLDKLPGKC